jgi:hypothetical protein
MRTIARFFERDCQVISDGSARCNLRPLVASIDREIQSCQRILTEWGLRRVHTEQVFIDPSLNSCKRGAIRSHDKDHAGSMSGRTK